MGLVRVESNSHQAPPSFSTGIAEIRRLDSPTSGVIVWTSSSPESSDSAAAP